VQTETAYPLGGIPAIGILLTVLALVSGAWLTWGKTRTP